MNLKPKQDSFVYETSSLRCFKMFFLPLRVCESAHTETAIVCFGLGAALVKAFSPKKVRAVNGLNKVPVSEFDIPKKYPHQ